MAASTRPAVRLKCLVNGCSNYTDEGGFVGGLCGPCHHMLLTGKVGSGQTFIHRLSAGLHASVDAWESLPGGQSHSAATIRDWLGNAMSPMIRKLRILLRREIPTHATAPEMSERARQRLEQFLKGPDRFLG